MNAENSNRLRTQQIVSLSPGIHLRKLQRILNASFTTTRYHVENLERDGEIVRSRDGRYSRLYPTGTDDNVKRVYAILQNRTARKVLQTLADNQRALTNGDLSKITRLPKSTVSEHTALLRQSMLVRSSTADGRAFYEVQDRKHVLQLLAAFERNLLSIATNSFIELWDL